MTFVSGDGVLLHSAFKVHPQPMATVLCVHGLGANQSALEWRAYRLYKRGFSVFFVRPASLRKIVGERHHGGCPRDGRRRGGS